MKKMTLGATGLAVSEFALGTFPFGSTVDEREAGLILDRFIGAGGTLVDTADMYQQGDSERMLGRLLQGRRDEVVIATKAYFGTGDVDANSSGASRRSLVRALEASLSRLKTDYIDLYYLHRFDETTPLVETLSALSDLVKSGKVRYVGCSNYTGYQLERAVHVSADVGCGPIAVVQNQYSLIERGVELELLPVARDHGVSVQAWSPLSAGFLTGKYDRDSDSGGRFSARLGSVTDEQWKALETLRTVAAELGVAPATVAISWLRSRGALPVIGATRVDHLDPSLAGSELELGSAHLGQLDSVAPPPEFYPYGFRTAPARAGLRPALVEAST